MESRTAPADNAGVSFPPPLLFLGALLLGFTLHRLIPWSIFHGSVWRLLSTPLVVCGVAILFSGRRQMAVHRTHVDPTKPTTTIVTSGPYRFSRNPLYLGLAITGLGISLALDTWWIALLLIPVLAILHCTVVRHEER